MFYNLYVLPTYASGSQLRAEKLALKYALNIYCLYPYIGTIL